MFIKEKFVLFFYGGNAKNHVLFQSLCSIYTFEFYFRAIRIRLKYFFFAKNLTVLSMNFKRKLSFKLKLKHSFSLSFHLLFSYKFFEYKASLWVLSHDSQNIQIQFVCCSLFKSFYRNNSIHANLISILATIQNPIFITVAAHPFEMDNNQQYPFDSH